MQGGIFSGIDAKSDLKEKRFVDAQQPKGRKRLMKIRTSAQIGA